MKPKCSLILLVLFTLMRAWAQETLPAHTLETAACLSEFNGAILSNSSAAPSPPLSFSCGETHNNLFYAFCPDTTSTHILVEAFNCLTGEGIQIVIYEITSYQDLTESFCFSEEFQLNLDTTLNLKPDHPYILMVDGNIGDECDFKISVSGIHENLSPIEQPTISDLTNLQMCLGDSRDFLITNAGAPCVIYQWLQNEESAITMSIGNDPGQVSVTAMEPGTVTICAEGTNFCQRKTTCLEIEIIAKPTIEIDLFDPICLAGSSIDLQNHWRETSNFYRKEDLQIYWYSEFPELSDLSSGNISSIVNFYSSFYAIAHSKQDSLQQCLSNVAESAIQEAEIILDYDLEPIDCGSGIQVNLQVKSNIAFEAEIEWLVKNDSSTYVSRFKNQDNQHLSINTENYKDSICLELRAISLFEPRNTNSCIKILNTKKCLVQENRQTVYFEGKDEICPGETIKISLNNANILPYIIEIQNGESIFQDTIYSESEELSVVAIAPEAIKILDLYDLQGCKIPYSGSLDITTIPGCVFVPNCFSPNEDGQNDYFTIHFRKPNLYNSLKSIKIYNRWGQLIFQKNKVDINPLVKIWDGTVNNKTLNPQTLLWSMELEYNNQEKVLLYGDISILK